MKIGVIMFPTDYAISPTDLAIAGEERGIESIWFPEHSHIPASRLTPWPGGGELPVKYCDTLDPLVALGAAASVTKTIKLCTGICLVIQRDPIYLAKEVATLDKLSNGRVILGIGAGWNAEEMADHGTDYKDRFKVMRERVGAMKAIWTEDQPEYHGTFVDFGPMTSRPKPVQKPYPPIIVGGGFPHGAKRAIEYGDGWMPIAGRGVDLLEQFSAFRQMAAEADRGPESMSLSVFGLDAETATADEITAYGNAGVERVLFMLPSEGADTILPLLDIAARYQ